MLIIATLILKCFDHVVKVSKRRTLITLNDDSIRHSSNLLIMIRKSKAWTVLYAAVQKPDTHLVITSDLLTEQ